MSCENVAYHQQTRSAVRLGEIVIVLTSLHASLTSTRNCERPSQAPSVFTRGETVMIFHASVFTKIIDRVSVINGYEPNLSGGKKIKCPTNSTYAHFQNSIRLRPRSIWRRLYWGALLIFNVKNTIFELFKPVKTNINTLASTANSRNHGLFCLLEEVSVKWHVMS